MKKSILFLFIIFQFDLFSQSTYYAFPDSNATWNETHYVVPSFCADVKAYEIYIAKDTLIGTYIYKTLKYHMHNYDEGGWCTNYYSSYSDGVYGLYRNDTTNKRIYVLNTLTFGNPTDSLLYDFSKSVGDTVNSMPNFYVIDSIKTIQIGNSTRRVFFVFTPVSGGNYNFEIIEGIGTLQGIFPVDGQFERYDSLLCFSQNNQPLYPDTNNACQHITSVKSYLQEKIKIFPNPANDKIYFEGINVNSTIRILNVLGETLLETQLQSDNLEIKHVKEGIYFLDILQNDRIVERKKIIIFH